ncbi:hypothetical protein GSI_09118 [Ganoderma sinense ZZ0214-1]|uniref:Uncharacterized protein n=1 Tax=Ganoderma sinense ZZ0214-1 TaxID=1077348 RepID=A0A2G8S5L8_9APHY|nr:hypothetical protein GSI_09118 [Ganoderma sinense ZZ0214-1]
MCLKSTSSELRRFPTEGNTSHEALVDHYGNILNQTGRRPQQKPDYRKKTSINHRPLTAPPGFWDTSIESNDLKTSPWGVLAPSIKHCRQSLRASLLPFPVQGGGEHIDINNVSSGSDDEAENMQPQHPYNPGAPDAAAANVAVRRGPVGSVAEVQAELHTYQAQASQLEKENRQLRESLQFMQNEVNSERKNGESKVPSELKPLDRLIRKAAVLYATQCRPWVPTSAFDPPPSWDIDPLDFGQCFPSEPGRSLSALKHAYSAELYKLVDPALRPHLGNAWVQARFTVLVLHRKSNMVNNTKGHLSDIFRPLHDAHLVISDDLSDVEKDPRCKYWRGEPGDEHPPIMYALGQHGDLRYVFQSMAFVNFIKIALFGSGALHIQNGRYDGKSFGRKHKITTLDYHMIAFAVTVLRFFLSHDAHFEERGKQSQTPFAEFYDKTFKALLEYQNDEWLSKILEWLHLQVFGTPLARNSGGADVNAPPPDVLPETGRQIRWEDLRTLARPQTDSDDLEYASAPVACPAAPAAAPPPSAAPALSWASMQPTGESVSGVSAPPPIPTSTRPSLGHVQLEDHILSSHVPPPSLPLSQSPSRLPAPPGLRRAGTGHWAVTPRPAGASSAVPDDVGATNSGVASDRLITSLSEIMLTGLPSTNVLSNDGAPRGVVPHSGGAYYSGMPGGIILNGANAPGGGVVILNDENAPSGGVIHGGVNLNGNSTPGGGVILNSGGAPGNGFMPNSGGASDGRAPSDVAPSGGIVTGPGVAPNGIAPNGGGTPSGDTLNGSAWNHSSTIKVPH